jgi:hypothetical protein
LKALGLKEAGEAVEAANDFAPGGMVSSFWKGGARSVYGLAKGYLTNDMTPVRQASDALTSGEAGRFMQVATLPIKVDDLCVCCVFKWANFADYPRTFDGGRRGAAKFSC